MTIAKRVMINCVVHVIYSGLGGHSAVMFALIEAGFCRDARHRVVMAGVEPPPEEYVRRLDELGIPWDYVGKRAGQGSLAFYRRLRRVILQDTPDLVFLNGLAAMPAVALCGSRRPIVLLRESQAAELKSRSDWGLLVLAHLVADAIVHLTPEAAAAAQARLGRLHRSSKVTVIPNGLDTAFFSPGIQSVEPDRPFRLGMVSRLQEIKDHSTLLAAFASLCAARPELPIELHIAGDGVTRPHIEAEITRLGLSGRVTMHGLLDRIGVRDLLRSLDIYVHATHGETMSNSIMQAMAAGLPIVASDVDGVSNMVCPGLGVLYRPCDPDDLAVRLGEWIDNPADAAAHGQHARAYALQYFSGAGMARRYEALLHGDGATGSGVEVQ